VSNEIFIGICVHSSFARRLFVLFVLFGHDFWTEIADGIFVWLHAGFSVVRNLLVLFACGLNHD
jgi:hypothetical protein